MSNEAVISKDSKILVVDDIKENLVLMTAILENEAYDVAFALNGEKAIEIAKRYQPDLILLDIMMPGIDGFETCIRLKSLNNLRNIPIIFVTGKVDPKGVTRAFAAGGVDYIAKPFRCEEVCARISAYIQLSTLRSACDQLNAQLCTAIVRKKQQAWIEKAPQKINRITKSFTELTAEVGEALALSTIAMTTLAQNHQVVRLALVEGDLSKIRQLDYLNNEKETLSFVQSRIGYACRIIKKCEQSVGRELSI